MGLLAFAKNGNVIGVRYLSLIDDTRWLDLADHFAQEACQVLSLPIDDPLTAVYVSNIEHYESRTSSADFKRAHMQCHSFSR